MANKLFVFQDFPIPNTNSYVTEKISFDAKESIEANINKFKNSVSGKDIICIVLEKPIENFPLSSNHPFPGLELIIWLRVHYINPPIIALSFANIGFVLKHTRFANILVSSGCTFAQLPFIDFNVIVDKAAKSNYEKNNFKYCLQTTTDIVKFKHAYANAWGLERLIQAHNEIFSKDQYTKYLNPYANDLHYNITRFLHQTNFNSDDSNFNSDDQTENLKGAISYSLGNLRSKVKNKNILYIDDKAQEGWLFFLQFLLPKCIITAIDGIAISKMNNSNIVALANDLFNKFVHLYKKQSIDFIISDLRLILADELETNYSQFSSMLLMRKIFDAKENGRLKYKNVRYMLFTASNQLTNYKNILYKDNKYAPNAIFVKEGIEQQNIPNQQFINYDNLLHSLYRIARNNYKNTDGGIDNGAQIKEIKQIDDFYDHLYNNTWKDKINSIAEKLKPYTHIICDTNIYLTDKPMIPLALEHQDLKGKHILTYPVYLELVRNAENRSEDAFSHFANYFVALYDNLDENTMKVSLSPISIRDIDQKKNIFKADSYFIEMLAHYTKEPNNKVLFITNDINIKPPETSSPYLEVEKYIKENKLTNLYLSKEDIKIIGSTQNPQKKPNTNKITVSTSSKNDIVLTFSQLTLNKDKLTFDNDGKTTEIFFGKKYRDEMIKLLKKAKEQQLNYKVEFIIQQNPIQNQFTIKSISTHFENLKKLLQ
jgi:hypothetical protein